MLRFGYGIGFRPLLNLVETMVISGIVLFGFGLLGEMIAGMQEETREVARALARFEKLDCGTEPVRVVFLTHNYPRWPGDVSGAFLATLAGALVRRGVVGAGGRAERSRGRAGKRSSDGIPVRRVRYASAGGETLAYRGTMQAALRAPAGLSALAGLWRALRARRA